MTASFHTFYFTAPPDSSDDNLLRGDLKLLASYNWHTSLPKHEKQSRISIPGSPALLHDLGKMTYPMKLQPDSESSLPHFKNQNVARAIWPMQPLFRAVGALAQEHNIFKQHDYILDRNILRALLNIQKRKLREEFAVEVQRVGPTLIMKRAGIDTVDAVTDYGRRGYGAAFENTFAAYPEGLDNVASYHTIVSYTLAGRKFMVRAEADATLELANPESMDNHHVFNYSDDAANFRETRIDVGLPDLAKLVELKSGQYIDIAQLYFGGLSLGMTGNIRNDLIRVSPHLHTERYPSWERTVPDLSMADWTALHSHELRCIVNLFDEMKYVMIECQLEHAVLRFEKGSLQLFQPENPTGLLPQEDLEVAFDLCKFRL